MTVPTPEARGTLADAMAFLWRHRILLVGMVGGVTLVTIVYVLVVPVQYTAEASVLPQDSATPGLFSAALAYMGGNISSLSLGGGSKEATLQEVIVRSSRLADVMNDDLDLDERYGTTKREERLRRWSKLLKTKTSKQGLLTVSYRDKDPEFAARVVTLLLQHLNEFNLEIRSTASRRVRQFLEERVAEAEARLNAAEDSLARYQAENQTLVLDPRVESVSALGADLLGQRMKLVTEAQMMRRTLGAEAPALKTKEMQIRALDQELARLPALNSALSKLLRSRRVYERTHTFLYAQLEESRIEEARDTPTVDILDPPLVPQEKSWPQRTWAVLQAFFGSGLLALVLAKGLDSAAEVRRGLKSHAA